MKGMYMLLCCCFAFAIAGANPVYNKLREVNSYWSAQKDIRESDLRVPPAASEHGWIRLHLSLVEKTLRQRSTAALSPAQRQLRARCLDDLHAYWQAGAFPLNEDYTYRTPIFIDRHNNFCAVGYMVKASGYEQLSRKIAAQTNIAYVREMQYPELVAWADEHGFTKDELAWIQPSYPPVAVAKGIGKGTDGIIYDLLADEAAGRLYAAGSFLTADSSFTANNIAYITEAAGDYTWHAMGNGINGTVYTLAMHNGHVYAAGDFSGAGGNAVNNVAYWDGSAWQAAGCLSGIVKKLAVLNGGLFAAGSFSVCGGGTCNFAQWDGTGWTAIPGISGRVNTLEPVAGGLLLGGMFSYNSDTVNVIQWQPGTGFSLYDTAIANEVNDFETFNGVLYAACRHTSETDSNLLYRLVQAAWVPIDTDWHAYYFAYDTLSFNTLHATDSNLKLGGYFRLAPMIGTFVSNMMDITPQRYNTDWAVVDSTIHKITSFRNKVIIAGSFRKGNYSTPLNGIASIVSDPSGVGAVHTGSTGPAYYPNPASSVLHITHGREIGSFILRDISGRVVLQQQAQHKYLQVQLPRLPSGVYTTELRDAGGQRFTGKLTIE